jgi:hypothetical protein
LNRTALTPSHTEPVSPDPNHRISIARSRSNGSRSNPRRPSPIERHRAKEKKGWAALRRRRQHPRRCGSGSPELCVPAAPRVKPSRLQAGEHHRDMGDRSRATAGRRGARASRATGRGGGHRRRAAFQGLRPAKDYGVRRKRTRERRGGSPRARGGRSCRGKWSSTMAVRRRWRCSRRMAVPRWPGPLGCGIRSGRLLL